jgi:hypothetical protein
MGADGEAPHAMDTNGMRIVAADGDSEADMRAADIGHEAQHRGRVKALDIL